MQNWFQIRNTNKFLLNSSMVEKMLGFNYFVQFLYAVGSSVGKEEGGGRITQVRTYSSPNIRHSQSMDINRTLRYSTVQFSTVQYSAVQYSTVQYSTVQYSTVQYKTVLNTMIQFSTLHCNTVQQYITVQCSAIQHNTLQKKYSTEQYNTVQ